MAGIRCGAALLSVLKLPMETKITAAWLDFVRANVPMEKHYYWSLFTGLVTEKKNQHVFSPHNL